ncbi:DDE superfamily endonuclease [Streptomyces sp. CG 926]|uniref:IS701 family transposase n=1 Tax=Streptomyces sp. CG 926 TaxID=1882405 RepID=UPI000D6AE22A|nr:transposase [Streptomyces sp. CG 926]PWK69556.1 DDE superfamily endonuclease [Streptomyces sp. CG 926]
MTTRTRTRALTAGDTTLADFTERLFGHLPRADQRRWARVYLQGLLSTPGKKSVRRLAASVTESPTASQSLQQFINASPWDWNPARTELLRWVEERHPVRAWTIGQVCFPKRGEHSVGVHRRFDPVAGRIVNCQLGFCLFLSLDGMSVPVDWRLALPQAWVTDPVLRRRARISPEAVHQAPEALVLELVDSIAARTSSAHPPVVADLSRLGSAAALIGVLGRRGHDFLVSVPPTLPVRAAAALTQGGAAARTGTPGRGGTTAGDFARLGNTSHPYSAPLAGPAGPAGGPQRQRIHSALVRLPEGEAAGRGAQQIYRLFGERRPGRQGAQGGQGGQGAGPVWLTNMNRHRMDDLLHLVRRSARSTAVLGSLADEFGLLDFEGRSFPGWHHHMTLMSAAYAYAYAVRERAELGRRSA